MSQVDGSVCIGLAKSFLGKKYIYLNGQKRIFKWKRLKSYNMQSISNDLNFALKVTRFSVGAVVIAAGEQKVFIISFTT